MTSEDGVKVFN